MSKDDEKLLEELPALLRRGRERFPARSHHRLCPYKPGETLEAGVICADCVYGAIAERGGR